MFKYKSTWFYTVQKPRCWGIFPSDCGLYFCKIFKKQFSHHYAPDIKTGVPSPQTLLCFTGNYIYNNGDIGLRRLHPDALKITEDRVRSFTVIWSGIVSYRTSQDGRRDLKPVNWSGHTAN